MQASLAFDAHTVCGWCRTDQATLVLYTVPTCIVCASGTAKERVNRWLASLNPERDDRQA